MESDRSRTKKKQWNARTEGEVDSKTPSQQICDAGLRGAVNDVCDVERRDFRGWHAPVGDLRVFGQKDRGATRGGTWLRQEKVRP